MQKNMNIAPVSNTKSLTTRKNMQHKCLEIKEWMIKKLIAGRDDYIQKIIWSLKS